MISTLIYVTILTFVEIQAFIVYDCRGPNVNVSVVSLKDISPCPEAEQDYTSERKNIQIVQRNEVKTVHVQACLVEITRIIMHCGMHSHSSAVSGGLSEQIFALGSQSCREAHRYKTIRVYNQIIGNLILNVTSIVGCDIAMLASLWDTLAMWAVHRHHQRQYRAHEPTVGYSGPNDSVEICMDETGPNSVPNNIHNHITSSRYSLENSRNSLYPTLSHWTET